MTYHRTSGSARALKLSGLGELAAGDKITLKFRPGSGVNERNAVRILDELRTVLLGTNHFTSPTYLGWGVGGTIVYKGSVRSANYTLRQIANMMPALAARVATRAGLPLAFISALDSDGDERVAEQSDPATPGGATPGGATPGGTTPVPGGGSDSSEGGGKNEPPEARDRESPTEKSEFPWAWVACAAGIAAVVSVMYWKSGR